MKTLLCLMVLLTSQFAYTKVSNNLTSKDTATLNRMVSWNYKTRSFVFDINNKDLFAYKSSTNSIPAFKFSKKNFCLAKGMVKAIETLIANPMFSNRLDITQLDFDFYYGPKIEVDSKMFEVELYSDPILRIPIGVYGDIEVINPTNESFCRILSQQDLIYALNEIAKNY